MIQVLVRDCHDQTFSLLVNPDHTADIIPLLLPNLALTKAGYLSYHGRALRCNVKLSMYGIHENSILEFHGRIIGGAQLGKAVKGRSKDKKTKKEQKGGELTEDERLLQERIKRMEISDYQKKVAQAAKTNLMEWMQREQKYATMNKLKIQNQWRKIMRLAKVESLRKDIEILSQNHERDVDRKDAIIQMLDRDLEEAEEQFQVALRSHLINVDRLVDLQDSRLLALESGFERDLSTIEGDFQVEREKIVRQHNMERNELMDIMQAVATEEREREAEAKQEHEQTREEIRNKNLEDINVLRITLDGNIEELEQHFETAHLNYLQNTDQRTQDFKYLTAKDQDLSKDIEIKIRKIEKLQAGLTHWRTKITQNVRECAERNAALQDEKEVLSKHFQELKTKMNAFRDLQSRNLKELAQSARSTKAQLQNNTEMAERIIKLGELTSKLESEQERVLPFYESTSDSNDPSAETAEHGQQGETSDQLQQLQIMPYQPRTIDSATGEAIAEWNYLDNFYKRYNKALLDNITIQRERERLEAENAELQCILKQYLDGISVNSDVMSQENPLFVVNGRVPLNQPRGKNSKNKNALDANQIQNTYVRSGYRE